ncbi:MAG: type II toxin-antitoxin system RelE/ParE family toxin [bacterium]|nr:type II toxin-antitoxin system RelE/ParE family toxin [bacterium]
MNTEDGHKYEAKFFDKVRSFIQKLTPIDQAKIAANIEAMQMGKFDSVYTKSLKGPIKELIVRKFRFIFFIEKHIIYFVSAFIKKTRKAPKQEIENSEKIYKIIKRIK